MKVEEIAYTNKEFLGGLSKMSCAMITQAVKDYMREVDTTDSMGVEDDIKKLKTKNSSIVKYKISAEAWLTGKVNGELSLQDCCALINSRLVLDGSIISLDEGISVSSIAQLVYQYNENKNINTELGLLAKITYLCDKDQKPKRDTFDSYKINIGTQYLTDNTDDFYVDTAETV